jgi:hypothetical protein
VACNKHEQHTSSELQQTFSINAELNGNIVSQPNTALGDTTAALFIHSFYSSWRQKYIDTRYVHPTYTLQKLKIMTININLLEIK